LCRGSTGAVAASGMSKFAPKLGPCRGNAPLRSDRAPPDHWNPAPLHRDGETRIRTDRTTSPVTARMPKPKDGETRIQTDRTTSPVTARMPKPKDGETRIRTGDTTIFSRVLYQLSYLAVGLAMVVGPAVRAPPHWVIVAQRR